MFQVSQLLRVLRQHGCDDTQLPTSNTLKANGPCPLLPLVFLHHTKSRHSIGSTPCQTDPDLPQARPTGALRLTTDVAPAETECPLLHSLKPINKPGAERRQDRFARQAL